MASFVDLLIASCFLFVRFLIIIEGGVAAIEGSITNIDTITGSRAGVYTKLAMDIIILMARSATGAMVGSTIGATRSFAIGYF